MAIFIDTPLDIAMARRLLRDYTDNPITEVKNDLINYLSRGRNAYLEMNKSVKPSSDIAIKGELPTQLIINQLLEEIKLRGF
ncbi:hypothetical protein [Paenibacillus planticolens]|uniref:Uridine kinase n=1 Tax=Paenibacillus planticolens TaxID=2654976 RepID=A0ABX1ZEN5_9BACL|nr:hypothetical protein [Paenibacillus planticolens]NOU98546.1 hypothetical protein [Paenibacillus planticolens]